MDKLEYNLGILDRLIAGTINGKPYIMLDDAKYVLQNSGVINDDQEQKETNVKNLLDRRPGTWPQYYDDCAAEDYQEYFIKGTNIKLGFDYIDGETGEHCWYQTVCDGYDVMDSYDTEEEFFEAIEWMLTTEHDGWRYYD